MVLVTGGAGYIGSHTIVDLLENDTACFSVDNFSRSDSQVFEGIYSITKQRVSNIAIDLCDAVAVEKIFQQYTIDAVIHFAAYKLVGESVLHPNIYYYNNINSLLNILNLCVKYEVKNFIFSSSCSVYGNAQTQPVNETTKLEPAQSPYAATKQIGEEIVHSYCKAYNLKAISLRYFNPIGVHPSLQIGDNPTNEPQNLLPALINFALGKTKTFRVYGTNYNTRDGSCIRDFIHVSDVAHAHVLALNLLHSLPDSNFYDVLNIGTGTGTTVLELINTLQQISNLKLDITYAEPRPGDVVAIYANNQKAYESLNWKAKYSLNDMLYTAWQFAKKNN